jgi:ubiquinone/menaquinone biosynthesis C-methylase UbiE
LNDASTDLPRESIPVIETSGSVIHWAYRYDLLLCVMTLGRERAFRERLVDLARIAEKENVLDIGCGTGTLALAAKRRVGIGGTLNAIDASPEMIARARKKAKRKRLDVHFQIAAAEALPLPDASQDAVLSVAMLHHLPDDVRRACISEAARVLKPDGRFFAADFVHATNARHADHHRQRAGHAHPHFDLREQIPLFTTAGFELLDSGPVGFRSLQFILASRPDNHSNRERRLTAPTGATQ